MILCRLFSENGITRTKYLVLAKTKGRKELTSTINFFSIDQKQVTEKY